MSRADNPQVYVLPFYGRYEESMDAFSPDPDVRRGERSYVQGDLQDDPQLFLGLVMGTKERETLIGVATALENEPEAPEHVRTLFGQIARTLVIAEKDYLGRLRAEQEAKEISSAGS